MSKIFAKVLLPLALDVLFSYKSEENIECGDVVLVGFGKKEVWGVVFEVGTEEPKDFDAKKVKNILAKNERLRFSAQQLKFIEIISTYNLASKGLVLRAFIGILNSDKVKKIPVAREQIAQKEKFALKTLMPEQQHAFDQLKLKIEKDPAAVSLLDGVTGSGKTEVYFALIAEILSASPEIPQQVRDDKITLSSRTCCGISGDTDKTQILILLPEIALTTQLLLRFEKQFGFKPAIWHSKITKKERREIFYGVAEGSVRVLVGARSALLLPFKNLKLIIIDEEHDASFKQEDVFNFHARDMAIVKAKLEGFPIILSSATPALETYANVASGKFHGFVLESRFGQHNSEIELVDLRREERENKVLSSSLRDEMALNIQNGKQTLLFLNRRGYAPVTLCKSCGEKYQCGDCDFHLVAHKSKRKLICHHCGHHEHLPTKCKFCDEKDALISVGIGVEKVEEEVRELFPTARIALATSDNITTFSDAEDMVQQILNEEIDVIIGTQMIAKGHDFPKLTLVGIVDADSMLFSSELRALERAYQLLTQVIGRAGRDKDAGKIIIQTYNPKNLIFEKIIEDDKKNFYEFELNNRELMDLPPFSRMAKFEISSFVEGDAKNFAKELIRNFPMNDKIEIFGPAPAPLQRLKNRHHFLVNLKVEKKVNLQKLVRDVMKNLKVPSSIRVRINIDPS